MKTVFISEESLAKLREKLVTKSKKDGLGDKSSCDGVIGSDGGANGFFHVSDNKSRLVESFNQFNMDDVDSISYSVECNVDDEYNWSDDYNSLDEYLADVEEYDGEVYDNDGHQLAFFSFSRHQLPDAFGEDIAKMMINRDGDERHGELWIEDISMIGTSGVDLDDVDAVNAVAKRISKPNGESHFLLTDGSVVSFHDHAQIQSIDGMTVSKFLELGNIRFGGGNVLSIELIKEPTVQQKLRLKRMLSYADEVYLDIAKPNKYDNMYPEVIIGVNYSSVNPDRIINDILNYFEEGIRPLGEMKVDYKSVIEEAAKKVVPTDLLKIAIKERPSWRERWAIICSNGVIEFYEKKAAPKAKNSLFWYRQWFGNNNVYFVDLDKVQLTENIESEVDASEINLSSFKKREELAPKIWYGRKLNSKVRLKLLDIADDFWDFANINWVKRSGILLTGSICGKNWSKYSDIDLHIVVDFSKVDERTDFVQEYFDLKKNEWNNNHKNLKIYGFPVELYVEDINADTKTSSKYDLEKNDWVKESDEDISIGLNKYSIKAKSANIMTKIDDLQDECDSTDDDAKLRDIGKRAKKLYRKIKRMRKFGLNRSGEGDSLNIIYKVLRRSGYLEKLWDLSSTLYDKVNSLNEGKESVDYFSLAKNHFGTTYDIRECGYILPDGSMLDFTGAHSIKKGSDSSYLRGHRAVDHREIYKFGWSEDGNEKLFNMDMSQFIRLGAIRVGVSKDYAFINLYVKPTKEQTNIISRIIRYAGGCVDVEIGDGDESLSHGEYDDANPRRIIADIFRYFDEGIKLNINEGKERINEYLDRDYNAPLYKYFKWAEKASDDELAKDLVYGHPYLAKRYIENSSDIEEFEGALEKYTDDDWYDEDVIDWFVDVLRKHNLCEVFIEYCRNRLAYFEWPSWMVMSFVRVVKNEWCIHFGEDSYSIARNGFKYGTGDVEQLAYTSRSANGHEGYNFAFPANYNRINTDYGEEAVLFQTSGVEIYHEGDCEHQVVFWGPYAKNFIPIKQVYGEWYVYGNKGQILYKSEDIDDIIRWAMNNKEQYRKQIMVGHG